MVQESMHALENYFYEISQEKYPNIDSWNKRSLERSKSV